MVFPGGFYAGDTIFTRILEYPPGMPRGMRGLQLCGAGAGIHESCVCMESARAASGERRDDMQYTHRETRDATGGGIEKIILEQI